MLETITAAVLLVSCFWLWRISYAITRGVNQLNTIAWILSDIYNNMD